METKTNLFGMTLAQLQGLCEAEGFPKYAARQMCDWLYGKGVAELDAMTNLSLRTRARLAQVATIERPAPAEVSQSADGTCKYLFPVGGGQWVEAVFIPNDRDEETTRATLCLSCQAGCRMGCRFCNTGRQGFHGNLSAAQILGQVFGLPERDRLTNIVFMGMGEPMDNYDAVMQSLEVLTAPWGLAWSPRRITVSSVGVTPAVLRFVRESQCHLAISLHNAFPAERAALMPAQRAYPLEELLSLLRQHDWGGQRRLSFEYTLMQGVNDDLAHAAALARLLRGMRCRVNLIRYHAAPGGDYRAPSPAAVSAFRDYLMRHGITCTLRASRGEDIMAACGLLAGRRAAAE